MNMNQLAKLIAGGLLAMAAVPAISLARTHHHVQSIAPSLSATTITPMNTTAKPAKRLSVSARKHKSLSMMKKSHRSLVHRKIAHTALSHRTLTHRGVRHTSLSHLSHKATKLSTKKSAL